MKKCLQACFSQFGTIVDVVLCKAYKLRGQAWVVFSTVEAATEAKTLMEGFQLYEKPLARAYVTPQHTESHVAAAAGVCKDQVGRGRKGGGRLCRPPTLRQGKAEG